MLSTEPVKSPDVKYKVCFTLSFEYPRYTTSVLTYIKTNLDCKASNENEDVTSKNSQDSSNDRTVSEQFLTLTENNSSQHSLLTIHSPVQQSLTPFSTHTPKPEVEISSTLLDMFQRSVASYNDIYYVSLCDVWH